MADGAGERVQLYVYDLSNGLARQLSRSLLGKQIDGVWHTSVIIAGREFYFGGGIQEAPAGSTPYGRPVQVVNLGETYVPDEVRREFIDEMQTKYSEMTYDLFSNNCNNFTDELAQFLTGNGIPAHITALPREVLATPFGQMIAPMLSSTMGNRLGHVHQPQAASASPPSHAAQQQPAAPAQSSPAEDVAEAIKSVAAVAAADTGIPVDRSASHSQQKSAAEAPRLPTQGVQELAEAHASLSSNPDHAASIAQADHPEKAPLAAANGGSIPPHSAPVNGKVQAARRLEAVGGRAGFEQAVRAEFERIMAEGQATANEAAALAVRRCRATASTS